MITIRNHETGEVIPISRDVTVEHPQWVHDQCETTSEEGLQAMLDCMNVADFDAAGGERDDCGILIAQ